LGKRNVGQVHGFGSVSNSAQANVNGDSGKEIGEELTTTWSRTTISQAMEDIENPFGQTTWLGLGQVRFGLSQSDASYAASGGSVSHAGSGALEWIVPAYWAHNSTIFHCQNGQPDEVHNVFVPKTWNVHGADVKRTADSSMDNFVAMANRDADVGSPLATNDHKFVIHGQSKSYDGFNEGFGILGVSANVHSESDFGEENRIDIYGSRDCGNSDSTTIYCYYWQDPANPNASHCSEEGACGSDVYTAVVPTAPLVPGPAPRPCTDRTPHNPCD